jgi:hypothetical protein
MQVKENMSINLLEVLSFCDDTKAASTWNSFFYRFYRYARFWYRDAYTSALC